MMVADSVNERLVKLMIYRIATGKWEAGEKLPSVRQAEKSWGVERRTVLKSYQRLEEMGLVKGVDRSGYYVATGDTHERVIKHRFELDKMFDSMSRDITAQTDLSPLGVFRYFSYLAEIKSRETPECAFVECTTTQASGHAQEIEQRLNIPCTALTVDQIADKPERIPPGIKYLITNPFHATRLRSLEEDSSLSLTSVPIELSPDIAHYVSELREAIVIEMIGQEAENIAGDLQAILPDINFSWRASEDLNGLLEETFRKTFDRNSSVVFVSPRVWGTIGSEWQKRPEVREATFRIKESAWPILADAIGLPLGALSVGTTLVEAAK